MAKVEPHQVRLVDFLKGQGLTRNNMETIIKSMELAREAGYIREGQSFIGLLKQDIRSAYYSAYFNDEPVYPQSAKVEWSPCTNGHTKPLFGCPECIKRREELEQEAASKKYTDDLEDIEEEEVEN